MLTISEISEAMEGERKSLMDDKLPHRKMAEVELADAIIRIGDYSGAYMIDLDSIDTAPLPEFPVNKAAALEQIASALCLAHTATLADDGGLHDFFIRRSIDLIVRYASHHGYDLWGAIDEKREYNRTREDHKPAARLAPGGKAF